MSFIDQIIDAFVGSEVFSFIDGFSRYNQIQIKLEDQQETTIICPWGTFVQNKIPFGFKKSVANFQWVMNFSFHDIKHIIEPYLDHLPAHSHKRKDHPDHLCMIFE